MTPDSLRARATFWCALPLVAPQGLRLRRTATRFPEADGPRCGAVGAGPGLSVAGLGDSIVAGVGAGTHDRGLVACTAAALARGLGRRVRWSATGRSGATSRDVIDELLPTLPAGPHDVVGISVGVNDVTQLARSRDWARRLGELLDRLREREPGAVLALAGLPPLRSFPLLPEPLRSVIALRARTFDAIARREAAARSGVLHVPLGDSLRRDGFAGDGYHPSPDGYRELGELFAGHIQESLRCGRSS